MMMYPSSSVATWPRTRAVAGSWPVVRDVSGGKGGGREERTDGVEEAVDGEVGDLARLGVANRDGLEEVLRRARFRISRVGEEGGEENARRLPLPRRAQSSRGS